MAKDVNLTSQEWCDIVFEEKNKAYGAYKIRRTSSKRHLIALIVVLGVALFITFLPFIIDTVKSATATTTDNIDDITTITNVDQKPDEKPEEQLQNDEPPPPPVKSTIQFTPPAVVDRSEIDEKNEIKSIDSLAAAKVDIGSQTIQGNTKDGQHPDDIPTTIVEQPVKKEPLRFVDQQPEYPGGEAAMRKFIQEHLQYPEAARKSGVDGTVSVQFVVNENGAISDVRIRKSPHQSLSDEATRVIKSMPRWIPGKQNGVNVAAYFNMPIVFKLQ